MGDMTVSALLDGKKHPLDPDLIVVEQREDLQANITD
jgi:hypothetical protein